MPIASRMSVVIVAHNMSRELPRTLRSLSSCMQTDTASLEIDLIVLDHGSEPPVDPAVVKSYHPTARVKRVEPRTCSPVAAINAVIRETLHPLIGVWIDGARLASPGLLRAAAEAAVLGSSPVMGTLSFHLGPDIQRLSIQNGYSQLEEDRLLASVDWENAGYRLFQIATLGGSSRNGWFCPIAETGSLFMTRDQWNDLGGYDERFQQPGGGLANLDLWRRAVLTPGAQPIMLLGEGTFHQIHGGAMTNAPKPMFESFDDEYLTLRGERYQLPCYQPLLLGRVPPEALQVLEWSAQRASEWQL